MMWPVILRRTKEAGINMVDTYVFWNLHEEKEGIYDFEEGYKNLPLFLQHAQKEGLLINLRIGPYVCAEWTYGGLPVWLLKKDGIEMRTWNEPFMKSMEKFVRKTLEVVKPFLASNGGPVALLQMENEFGNIAKEKGEDGRKYILWAAELAKSLEVDIPWIMCQQDDIPIVINTCNGFYCDNWISGHQKQFPNQPSFFTEDWTGWFQHYGNPKPTRHVADIAFSTARFIARGGSYVAYYMWHGGTNFGRWGSSYKTASYDYDAPMTEYGFPAVPKYEHLKRLHEVLNQHSRLILNNEPLEGSFGPYAEIHIYGSPYAHRQQLVFLSNWDSTSSITVPFGGEQHTLPPWSVTILHRSQTGVLTHLYCTATIHPTIPAPHPYTNPHTSNLTLRPSHITWRAEPPAPRNGPRITANRPREQVRTTWDETDYMWYVREGIQVNEGEEWVRIVIDKFEDVGYLFWDGVLVGSLIGGKTEDLWDGKERMVLRESGGEATSVTFRNTPKENHTLAVLSSVAGLMNDGPYMERVEKGILGKVFVNGVDVTEGEWVHQVGLFDEDDKSSPQTWSTTNLPTHTPLTHYRLTFPFPALLQLSSQAVRQNHHNTPNPTLLPSFALNLTTLTRGHATVNSHPIGRYWNITNDEWENCLPGGKGEKECDYRGGFWVGKCVECRGRSQGFWHVPYEWVLEGEGRGGGEGGEDVVVVEVFEEKGGDPSGVEFVALAG
ncbi:hypothetical protein HDV00_008501 [Rhizophlyctis rosea]|nr:hypothetical protein HDV00_008501 [Rhizophlyctis rosea]